MVRPTAGRSTSAVCSAFCCSSPPCYFAVNVGEPYLRFYRYRDAMRQEVRFAAHFTDDDILRHLPRSRIRSACPRRRDASVSGAQPNRISLSSRTTSTSSCRSSCATFSSRRRPRGPFEPLDPQRKVMSWAALARLARAAARSRRVHQRRVRPAASRARRRARRRAAHAATRSSSASTATHSVRRLKGPERPVRSEAERAYVLAALEAVDASLFEQDTPLELVSSAAARRAREGRRLHARTPIVGAPEVRRVGRRRRRHSAHARAFHHLHHRDAPWPLTARPNARAGRRDDDLRPVTLERSVAPYAEGSCLVSFGDDARAVHRVGRGRRSRLATRTRRGLAHRRVRDAAARDAARAPRASARSRRPHAGDPAADRPQRSRDARRLRVRRVHAQARLRRAAGRRRDAHGGDHRRVRRGVRRVRLDGRRRASCSDRR